MDDLQAQLLRLTQNRAILQEREAKYVGQAPLALLNQIEDYQTAIQLYEQTLAGQLTPAELVAQLQPLNLELPPSPVSIPLALALHQLPSPPPDFIGRTAELAELTAALEQGGVTISGLRGMGGIGKTALALKLAERLAPRYPDAQFYMDLRGANPQPLPAAAALAHVIRAYHPTVKLPEAEIELRGLFLSALHGQRALLLMDNAANAAQVEPLIPPPGCALLVTSRHHFHLPGLYAKNLDTLPPEDARKLLLTIAPRIQPPPRPSPYRGEGDSSPLLGGEATPAGGRGVRSREADTADTLASLCGYLPLALRLAGSALAERPDLSPDTYLRRLAKAQKRLELIDASLSLSYDLLNPELRRLWCALAVFPADFDLPAIAAIWNLDPDAADEWLGELLKYSLVEFQQGSGGAGEQGREVSPPSPGRRGAGGEVESRYKLHDLARLFADSRLDPTARAEAQQRHAAHYESVYRAAIELYQQGSDNILLGLALFDREWVNIQTGQTWAEKNIASNDSAAALCSAYVDWPILLELRQHPRERIHWLEAALAAARRLKNRSMEGVHLGNLGIAYYRLGETRRAIEFYEQHLAIAREIGDWQGEGNALGNLGVAYDELGETRRAIEYYEQLLVIAREISDRRGEANALMNTGIAVQRLGESRRAIEFHEQALNVFREIGDRRGEANALMNIGNAFYSLGELRRAIEFHEQALSVFREISDQWGEGNTLGSLGLAYADLGETRRAIEFYEQRLAIAREIGDRWDEGNALWNKALALDQLGERAQAIAHAEVALQIFEQIESPYVERVRERLARWSESDKKWWQFWK